MGQWINSKEFALQYNLVKKSLEKACFRAKQHGKKICMVKSNILYFDYTNGIGRGGKSSKYGVSLLRVRLKQMSL